MRFFKPNIERLRERQDIQGLVKALSDQEPGLALKALDALIDLRQGAALLEAFRVQQAWDNWQFVGDRCRDKLGRDAVPTLLAALHSPVHLTAMIRLTDLLPMPDAPHLERAVKERLVPAVLAYASDDSATARGLAVRLLARLDDGLARVAIVDALGDASEEVRVVAAETIGASRGASADAIDSLVASLGDASVKVRRAAAEALGKCHWTPAPDTSGAAYWAVREEWDRCAAVGAAAVEPLLRELAVEEPHRQRSVIAALDRIGDRRAIEPLRQLLGRPQMLGVKDAALAALIRLQDARAVLWGLEHTENLTVALLKDRGEEGIRLALYALTEQTPPSPWVAKALDALGWAPTLDAQGAAYWAARRDWDQCVHVGEAAIPLLEATLAGPDLIARVAAATGLAKLNWSPPTDALGAAYWVALGDWRHCVAMGNVALPVLCDVLTTMRLAPVGVILTNEDYIAASRAFEAMRVTAAKALGELRGQAAFEALQRYMSQSHPSEASHEVYTVAQSLARYGAAGAETLIHALNFSSQHDDWGWCQRAILRVLDEISRGGELSESERAKVDTAVRNHIVTTRNPDLDQW